MDSRQEYVIRRVAQRDVRHVRLVFVDILGIQKSVTTTLGELKRTPTEGVASGGSSIEGFTRISESDMLLFPNADIFQAVPLIEENSVDFVGCVFCDVLSPNGTQSYADPCYILEWTIKRAERLSFVPCIHPEIEFHLFRPPASAEEELIPIGDGSHLDHVSGSVGSKFRYRTVQVLEELGVSVEFTHHEIGLGQYEIDLRSIDVLSCAGNFATLWTIVEEMALTERLLATSIPKLVIEYPENGLHLHPSLHKGSRNVFYDPAADYHLSIVGWRFTTGLLHYAKEASTVVNQHMNLYKRLWGGSETPAFICQGHHNRGALIYVANYKSGTYTSTRVEYRAPDPLSNPYLTFALIIEARLRGIEQRLELPEEAEDNVWQISDAERRATGIPVLPCPLTDALNYLAESKLVPMVLGGGTFDSMLRARHAEWESYRHQIALQERR